MADKIILGFTGKMGVGKSTAVRYLLEQHRGVGPGNVVAVRFAAPLYALQDKIYACLPMSLRPTPDTHPGLFVGGVLKDRRLLQWLGTDWGREISPSLWIDIWKLEVYQQRLLNRHVLVEDVRFDNEAETIRALGGHVVRIIGKDDNKGVQRGGIKGHASEEGISPKLVDITLQNLGTERSFLGKVGDLWTKLNA